MIVSTKLIVINELRNFVRYFFDGGMIGHLKCYGVFCVDQVYFDRNLVIIVLLHEFNNFY